MNAKDKSKAGGRTIADYAAEIPPNTGGLIPNPGLPQPKPKNPLYELFMDEMQNTFVKDDPKKGGIGYRSMWKRYDTFGALVSRMRTVDAGNIGAWTAQQRGNPELQDWLRERKIDPFNFDQVRNYYQTQRNNTAQRILWTIQATEQRIDKLPEVRQQLGNKHFKVNMLDPRTPGIQPEGVEQDENPV